MEENQKNLFTMQDVWDEKDKNTPSDPTKTYDPQHFWDDYGEKFYNSHSKREMFQFGLNGNNPVAWLIFKMKSLKLDTVLEAGCGFARLAPFVIDGGAAKEYHGIDFSEKVLKASELYLKDYANINHVHLQKGTAKRMPFSNASIDCVFSSEVLTHMTRAKANHCIREFARVASKYVIVVERYVFTGEHPYPHMWSHNLISLAENAGLSVIESKMIGAGMCAVICEV